MNKTLLPLVAATASLAILAGCASRTDTAEPAGKTARGKPVPAAPAAAGNASVAFTVDAYKRDVARHISATHAARVYPGRPQALLRSVVVVKYTVDADGRLVRSGILRSNHDRVTESSALQSLRTAAPLPRPAHHLLRNGQLDVTETWLFNDDGRFQIRSVAQPQMDS